MSVFIFFKLGLLRSAFSASIYSRLPVCLISDMRQFLILSHTFHYHKNALQKRETDSDAFWLSIHLGSMQEITIHDQGMKVSAKSMYKYKYKDGLQITEHKRKIRPI